MKVKPIFMGCQNIYMNNTVIKDLYEKFNNSGKFKCFLLNQQVLCNKYLKNVSYFNFLNTINTHIIYINCMQNITASAESIALFYIALESEIEGLRCGSAKEGYLGKLQTTLKDLKSFLDTNFILVNQYMNDIKIVQQDWFIALLEKVSLEERKDGIEVYLSPSPGPGDKMRQSYKDCIKPIIKEVKNIRYKKPHSLHSILKSASESPNDLRRNKKKVVFSMYF
jgi:hypothetical protein